MRHFESQKWHKKMKLLTLRDFLRGRYLQQRAGSYYLRMRILGRDVRKSLGTRDLPTAAQRAYDAYKAALAAYGCAPTTRAPRGTAIELDALYKIYLSGIVAASAGKCSATTANGNVNALRRITAACGLKAPRLTDLTAALVARWRALKYAQRGLPPHMQDISLNYSLNSELAHARALFGRAAMALYAAHGLKMPAALAGFAKAPALKAKSTRFTPIPAHIDAAIRAQCTISISNALNLPIPPQITAAADIGIGSTPPPEVALAVELARYCALTSKELEQVSWHWLTADTNGNYILDIRPRPACAGHPAFVAKNNAKYGRIPTAAAAVERWRAISKPRNPTDYIILPRASPTARQDLIKRTANAWLKPYLPDRVKKLHELRKQAGSDVLTRTGSIKRAADFIRDTTATAERHYTSLLTPTAPIYDVPQTQH